MQLILCDERGTSNTASHQMFFDKFTQIILVMTYDKDQEMAWSPRGPMWQWTVAELREKARGRDGRRGKRRELWGGMFDLVLFNIFINDPEEG